MMQRNLMFMLLTLLFFQQAGAQSEIILEIGDTQISKEEFVRIYKKNNSNLYEEKDIKSPEEYMDLFINYKLKVQEAKDLKLDTSRAFVDELEGYRNELATPYLTDIQYNKNLEKELYQRMLEEVHASHILIRIKPNATGEELERSRQKAESIRNKIMGGMDFGEAAVKFSEDPSAANNHGDLNYFSAFQMVAPFENAAYTTPVGEVSQPVRTSFGYHLIKVHDVRKNKGEIKVAHIMKIFPKGMRADQKKKLKEEINAIYDELKNGADFTALARTKSDDRRSAAKGGEMPWFSAGRMINAFSDPAFALEEKGDYTPPVETQFGYHIIMKMDERGIKPFEELQPEIENRIKKDPERSSASRKSFLEKIKKEYRFTENAGAMDQLKDYRIDSMAEIPDLTLFTLNNVSFGTDRFENFLHEQKISSGKLMDSYPAWQEKEIVAYEDSRLEEKYPEFKYMLQEFYEGILLFNISEDKVWNKAAKDTLGLQTFYEKNKDNHRVDEQFRGLLIQCKDSAAKEEVDKYFSEEIPYTEILDLMNVDKERITIQSGNWEKGENPVIDYYVWGVDSINGSSVVNNFVRGDLVKDEPKTLEESRGLHIADYQKYLEEKWIKELRKKYRVKIHKKVLKSIEST